MENIYSNEFYKVTADVKCKAEVIKTSDEKTKFDFEWDLEDKTEGTVNISFSVPCTGIEGIWEPTCLMNRNYNLRSFETTAMGAVPLLAYYNNIGNSIFSIALSDSINQIKYFFAINERTAEMDCKITIDLKQFGKKNGYSITLYTQKEELPLYEMCKNVSDWWEEIYDLRNIKIPEGADEMCYQTWYAFHHDIDEARVLKSFSNANDFGMKTVILDDGWMTDDKTTGAKYTGDYEVSKLKFPDIKELVNRVHKMGQKILLWYSASFVGFESKAWNTFKDKIIGKNHHMGVGILDPRYPEVREHMIRLFERTVRDWDFDGIKLDFIDSFRTGDMCDAKEGMDCISVPEGVEKYLSELTEKLKAIKQDVIVEFHQGYVGPNMRKYSSIFGVTDCPEDYRFNRVGMVDLRMLSGNTVIYADMLMWNKNDMPEIAALQILNTLFAVIQFSVDFDKMTPEQKKVAKFWLGFSLEHKELLIKSQIKPQEVNSFYPIIKTENDEEAITAVYEINKIIGVDASKKNYLINACDSERMVIDADIAAELNFESYDCMGNLKDSGVIKLNKGINTISVCKSGLFITKSITD